MGQKILLTGATGGFGKLTALALSQAGHSVVGTTRSLSRNKEVIDQLSTAGIQLVEMDVTDEQSVERGATIAMERLGGIDAVINNAGIGSFGIQELFSTPDMQKVFDVNVFGVQRVMRAVLPLFRKQGSGTALFISSLIGRIVTPFYGTYCASKWALEALVESYRAELSGFGIESCIVEPGAMPTAFFDGLLQPNDVDRKAEYGAFATVPEQSNDGIIQALAATHEQRPEKVADAIVEVLDQPFGEKPFRTVVDYLGVGPHIERYNETLKEVTQEVYDSFGMERMLSLNK